MSSPKNQRFGILLCLLALTACGGKALGSEPAGRSIQTQYGYNVRVVPAADRARAPNFSGPDLLDGSTIDAKDFTGMVRVVNFWASDCGPCRKEEPILAALAKRYEAKGVRFLGIDSERSKTNGRTFVREFGVAYPSIFDPYFEIAYRFRVFFLPATYVIDRKGRIAAIIFGATTDEHQLVRIIEEEAAA